MTDLFVFLAGFFPSLALVVHWVVERRKILGKDVGAILDVINKVLVALVLIEVAFLVLVFLRFIAG